MKYSVFFNSIISFIKRTDLLGNYQFKGLSKKEINEFQYSNNIVLPTVLEEYLKLFGLQFSFYNIKNHEYLIGVEHIKKAVELFKRFEIKLQLGRSEINNAIPILYDSHRFQMILLSPDNSTDKMFIINELYLSEDDDFLETDDLEIYPYLSFTENIRERLFLETKNLFYPHNKSKRIDLSQIEWVKFHFFYHSTRELNYKIGFSRRKFRELIRQKGLLLDFEAYEVQFIKYLIEEKNVPPIPEIFDPYNWK